MAREGRAGMAGSMNGRSLVVIVALGSAVAGCGSADDGNFVPLPSLSAASTAPGSVRPTAPVRGVTLARATAAHQRYRDVIRRRYRGVQGTGVGIVDLTSRSPRPGDPVYGIIVFVDEPAHRPRSPQSIAGVPLRFRVSGHFVLQ